MFIYNIKQTNYGKRCNFYHWPRNMLNCILAVVVEAGAAAAAADEHDKALGPGWVARELK
jgi:hypothetical protein